MRKLKSVREPDGSTMVDNALAVMGSGLHTGNQPRNLPILPGGSTAGGCRHGQHFSFEKDKSRLADLWLSMLKHSGCPVDSFADSTGPLT